MTTDSYEIFEKNDIFERKIGAFGTEEEISDEFLIQIDKIKKEVRFTNTEGEIIKETFRED
jgi:hypothetical protein